MGSSPPWLTTQTINQNPSWLQVLGKSNMLMWRSFWRKHSGCTYCSQSALGKVPHVPGPQFPHVWCFWTVMLEKTLESPLDCKEIQPVDPKGNQPWIFIGRTDAEAEAPILWPLDVKNQLFGKDPHAGKDWGLEEKGRQRMRWLDGITDSMGMSLSLTGRWWRTGQLGVLQSMGSQRVGHWVTEQWQRGIIWATLLVLRDSLLGVFVETEGAAPGGVSLHALPWQVLPSTSFPQCTPALISFEQGSIV